MSSKAIYHALRRNSPLGQNQSLFLNGVICHSPNKRQAFACSRGFRLPHNDVAGLHHGTCPCYWYWSIVKIIPWPMHMMLDIRAVSEVQLRYSSTCTIAVPSWYCTYSPCTQLELGPDPQPSPAKPCLGSNGNATGRGQGCRKRYQNAWNIRTGFQ